MPAISEDDTLWPEIETTLETLTYKHLFTVGGWEVEAFISHLAKVIRKGEKREAKKALACLIAFAATSYQALADSRSEPIDEIDISRFKGVDAVSGKKRHVFQIEYVTQDRDPAKEPMRAGDSEPPVHHTAEPNKPSTWGEVHNMPADPEPHLEREIAPDTGCHPELPALATLAPAPEVSADPAPYADHVQG